MPLNLLDPQHLTKSLVETEAAILFAKKKHRFLKIPPKMIILSLYSIR